MHKLKITLLFVFVLCYTVNAQTYPVGQLDVDGSIRNLQLMGKVSNRVSFTVRPMYSGKVDSFLRMIDSNANLTNKKILFGKSLHNGVTLLPLILSTKFNSHHPYGWNDEAMIAAKGFQNIFTTGIHLRYGPLTVQLQPQYFYASNPNFEHANGYGAPTSGSYSKFLAGQSSVRLNAGPLSVGYSSENLWWGPGQFSSLLLSNNAPGFKHFTINTTRPIKTPFGHFEFQIFGGKLGEDSADISSLYENFFLTPVSLKNEWRYMNAMVVSYQPIFLKGFFLGGTRSFQLYGNDFNLQESSIIQKYVPVLSALFKNNTSNEDARARDQQLSVFARWLLEKYNSEFYFEYGYNDHSANIRDFMLDPTHSAAYIVGSKKLFKLPKNDLLELSVEITQMAQSNSYLVRNAGNWYIHGQVLQGLTNEKQIMGAGSGMGNNVQTFSATWLKGIKKVGIKLQRIQQDPKGFRGGLGTLLLSESPWSDFSIGVLTRWNYKKLLFSAELQQVTSHNYAWQKNTDRGNFYGLFNIAYKW